MAIMRSGRVYQGPEPADKGKAPAATFSAIPEAVPLPVKKVTKQEDEAFMKVIKASEYKVVEQMGKSSAHISLLALLLSSELHCDALLKVPTAAQVLKDTALDRIEETMNSIFSNQISFADDELSSEGQGHLRALHIVCKCNNHVVGRVMIDNVYKVTAVPYISIGEDQNLPFHSFDTISVIRDYGEVGPSRADRMIGNLLLKNDYVPGAGLGERAQGILGPIKVEEYRNRRGLGFRPSCHEIVQARRGKHLSHCTLRKALLGAFRCHRFRSFPPHHRRSLEAPPTAYPINQMTPLRMQLKRSWLCQPYMPSLRRHLPGFISVLHGRMRSLQTGLQSRSTRPWLPMSFLFLKQFAFISKLQSNPNHGCDDSNSSETRLGKSLPINFGEGLDEDGRMPEIEESLHRLENHQLSLVKPAEEVNIGTAEEQCILRIETSLDLTQKARMIDFLTEYQEVFTWSYAGMPGLDPYIRTRMLTFVGARIARFWITWLGSVHLSEDA
ncbi:hypothetical protein CRG98_037601 [Punica granatum]|uniref:G-patch domain-containing protein n=1 Tax=Punica granatum TaxID=22663 RepID=A0A2I0IDV5_PUNGR|nr:hypothetical protein CRG98_037601 [Punica granatum]